jgi:peptide deformylase
MTKKDNTLEARVLPVLVWPDKRLRVQCKVVTIFDHNLQRLASDMFATMRYNNGVGLAAPQVAIHLNVIAVWLEENAEQIFLANPKIVEESEDLFAWNEGCLSVPGYFEDRRRPNIISVTFQDIVGKEHTQKFEGLIAFAIQHEIDHLRGKVFVDEASQFKKSRIKEKVKKHIRRRM